jgi:hypothetical protein
VPVLAIVFGVLLVLFGGGCTLIYGGTILSNDDPMGNLQQIGFLLMITGLLPFALGIILMVWGIRADRERRRQRLKKE